MADMQLSTDLTTHAHQLDGISDGIKQAIDAANAVSMPTDAYGILCQPFRMMLDPIEQYGIKALQDASQAMTAVSGDVRQAALGFATNDQDAADALRKAGGE